MTKKQLSSLKEKSPDKSHHFIDRWWQDTCRSDVSCIYYILINNADGMLQHKSSVMKSGTFNVIGMSTGWIQIIIWKYEPHCMHLQSDHGRTTLEVHQKIKLQFFRLSACLLVILTIWKLPGSGYKLHKNVTGGFIMLTQTQTCTLKGLSK